MEGGLGDQWSEIVEVALDSLIPVYDKMNSVMSFGKDLFWRERGIRKALNGSEKLLDAGCGPGVMTEVATTIFPSLKPVMLDALGSMLGHASIRTLGKNSGLVRGVFERLPFKDKQFDAVMMGFSFRDAQNMRQALFEISRVLKENGKLLIVDISKPDSSFARTLIGFYWHFLVPMAAYFVANKYWRHYKVLYTTYKKLPRNFELKRMILEFFDELETETKMMGGLIILVAKKTSN
jgi:demethylmenaquinone methyltransferase/2-methoxy-6-polyprenyl-1,4-benzoquinol methylase